MAGRLDKKMTSRSPNLESGHGNALASPIVSLKGIEKSYPGVKALRGVDLEIHGGEIHCLVGENGAGKSTLMRILTGAAQPDAGAIVIDGETLRGLSPATAITLGIGIVYQEGTRPYSCDEYCGERIPGPRACRPFWNNR